MAGRPAATEHIVPPNLVLDRDEIVEELENANHRSIVEETRQDINGWLARHGLIHNTCTCPNCNHPCRLIARADINDGKRWSCRDCRFTKSIRADSFFENSHLSLTEILDFIYFWSRKVPLTYIMEETGIENWHTAVDWANFIRDICGLWYVLQNFEWQN